MASAPMALRTRYARVARSKMTIAFFLFVLVNFAAQATLHTRIFLHYARYHNLVENAIDAAGVQRGFVVFQNGVLEICSGIPAVYGTMCYTIYSSSTISIPALANMQQCAEGLTWAENYFSNSGREEIVYLVLQSWLALISLLALSDESIPNLIVVLAAQVVNTGWISYRLVDDTSAKRIYDEIIVDGTCEGSDILGGSWLSAELQVTLGCSIAALLGTIFFVFKLVKLYSEGTLSSVGSSPVIERLLKWRLWMRVFLQFTTFFVLASSAIWYDKRTTGMISPYSKNTMYDVGFYIVAIIVLPWLALGIYSISKENCLLFFAYAFLSIALLTISGLWFGSALFRYEYTTWSSFACLITMADVLLVTTCILSVICRLNFGRGLAHFLVVERALQASGFTPDVFMRSSSSTTPSIIKQERLTSIIVISSLKFSDSESSSGDWLDGRQDAASPDISGACSRKKHSSSGPLEQFLKMDEH